MCVPTSCDTAAQRWVCSEKSEMGFLSVVGAAKRSAGLSEGEEAAPPPARAVAPKASTTKAFSANL